VTAVDTKYKVNLDQEHWQNKKLKDIHDDLHDMFEDVLNEAKQGAADNDSGKVLVHHPSLNDATVVPLRPLEMLNADVVMEHIEKVLQSHENLAITDGFEVDVGIINVPKGSGWMKITDVHSDNNSIKKKKSIVQIVNEDILCMSRTIAVSCARINKVTTKEWREMIENELKCSMLYKVMKYRKTAPLYYENLINNDRNKQKEMAMPLCESVNLPTCVLIYRAAKK